MKATLRLFMIIALGLVPMATAPLAAKEGFGFTAFGGASVATLDRVSPPVVFLPGKRIAVKANSAAGDDADAARRLQGQLESELLSRDKRLSADTNHPEILIEVEVLEDQGEERWETRRETQSRKIGEDQKGRAVYQNYEVDVRYKILSHSFNASFKVTDMLHRSNLDADSIPLHFSGSFREGRGAAQEGAGVLGRLLSPLAGGGGPAAPSLAELESKAITQVVETIARRLTPTKERVGVLLPKGSLEESSGLAKAGLWDRFLETLEKRAPLPETRDESYRQYAIGVAYEAIAYGAEDEASSLKYLEQAAISYNKAIEANTKEKYFREPYDPVLSSKQALPPLARVNSALQNYRRLLDFKEHPPTGDLIATGAGKSVEPGAAEPRPQGPPRLDNGAVVQMARAGLAQDVILNALSGADPANFDLSAQGLISLAEAGVDKAIILRMQALAQAKTRSTSAPASAAKAKKPPGTAKDRPSNKPKPPQKGDHR